MKDDPIQKWAEKYSSTLGEVHPTHRPISQRARLLLATRAQPAKRNWLRPTFLAATTLALALVVGIVTLPQRTEIQAPQVSTAKKIFVAREEPIATQLAPRTVQLSPSSQAVFEERTSGSISLATEEKVELTLAEGSLSLSAEKDDRRTYVVHAGKFRVSVIKAAFWIQRDERAGTFEVRVRDGVARIEGTNVGGGPRVVRAGERFRWEAADNEGSNPSSNVAREEIREKSDAPAAKKSAASPAAQEATTQSAPPAAPTWQSLANAGKYQLAVEQVERIGSAQVLARANADEHVLLGNAARYSGKSDLSSRAYLAARKGSGPSATLAAYYLARVALDTNGDQGGAISWLRTYLREAPNGDLAATARARLMTLLSGLGRKVEAQKVARDYLKHHPSGPHGSAATALLERP